MKRVRRILLMVIQNPMIEIRHSKIVQFSWLLTLLTIPLLSVFGRPLQKWFYAQVGVKYVGAVLGSALFAIGLYAAYKMIKKRGRKQLLRMFWSAPLLIIILITTQSVVELSHVIIFGLFGFLSLRLFPITYAIILCIAVSGFDELLQFFLADRVGDWQDVLLNFMSTGLGGIWAFLYKPPQEENQQIADC